MRQTATPSEIALRQNPGRRRITRSKEGSFTCAYEPACPAHDGKVISDCHLKEPMKIARRLPFPTMNKMSFVHNGKPYTAPHSETGNHFRPHLLYALPSFGVVKSTPNKFEKKNRTFSIENHTGPLSGYNSSTLVPSRMLRSEDLPTLISDSTNSGPFQKLNRNTHRTSAAAPDTLQKKNLNQTGLPTGSHRLRRSANTIPSTQLSFQSSFQESSLLSGQNSIPCVCACKLHKCTLFLSSKLCKRLQPQEPTMQASLGVWAPTNPRSNCKELRVTPMSSVLSLNTAGATPLHTIPSLTNHGKDSPSSTDHSLLLWSSPPSLHSRPYVGDFPTPDATKNSSTKVDEMCSIREGIDDKKKFSDTLMTSIIFDNTRRRRSKYLSPLRREFHCASGIVEVLPVSNSISDLGLISLSGSYMRWVCKQNDAVEKKELQQFEARYYKRLEASLDCLGGPRCSATDKINLCSKSGRGVSRLIAPSPDHQPLATRPALRLPAFVARSCMTSAASRSRWSLYMPKIPHGRPPSRHTLQESTPHRIKERFACGECVVNSSHDLIGKTDGHAKSPKGIRNNIFAKAFDYDLKSSMLF